MWKRAALYDALDACRASALGGRRRRGKVGHVIVTTLICKMLMKGERCKEW